MKCVNALKLQLQQDLHIFYTEKWREKKIFIVNITHLLLAQYLCAFLDVA